MKTAVISSPLIASSNMQSSIMGMDEAGMNTATYFMRDKIYTDKIQAVVREYICNAVDEHQKHKISKPVLVGLRNKNSSTEFYVRDFAKGLSEEGVRSIFGMYFRSTKSKSNDSIGGFGVGSKAGHCYTDTFFVTSHYEGVKSTYTCMLGGGDSGVPVGHIYKIDESPTEETGIEVSLEINQDDYYSFDDKISEFVTFSPFNIEFLSRKDIRKAAKTVFEKQLGRFNIRLVESAGNNLRSKLQMGGVTYQNIRWNIPYKVKRDHCLIIDIPIGTMSIPISRESFESTANNEKVLTEIHSLIKEFSENDLLKFKNKTIMDLLKEKSSSLHDIKYVGEVFESSPYVLYDKEIVVAGSILQSFSSEPVQTETSSCGKKVKPVLIILPNQSSYWKSKICSYCENNKINFYYTASEHSDLRQICEDFFVIKSIKTLKFPKIEKQHQKYTVWGRTFRVGLFNASEFNKFILKDIHKISEDDIPSNVVTEEDFYKFNREKFSKVSNFSELKGFVFCGHNHLAKTRDVHYYTSSKILTEELKKYGWIEYNSPEYISAVSKITNKITQENEIQEKRHSARRNWVIYNNKTSEKIESNPDFAEKIGSFWQKVLKENSVRGKIFSCMNKTYSPPKLNRAEIRQILKLK